MISKHDVGGNILGFSYDECRHLLIRLDQIVRPLPERRGTSVIMGDFRCDLSATSVIVGFPFSLRMCRLQIAVR